MAEPYSDRDTPIDFQAFSHFEWSMMTRGCITTHGILSVCGSLDIHALPAFGDKRMKRVEAYAKDHGFRLRWASESFQDRAAEVYGDLRHAPVEVAVIPLIRFNWIDRGRYSYDVVTALKNVGVVTIGDFRDLDRRDFEAAVNKYSPLFYCLNGWLIGAGIIPHY